VLSGRLKELIEADVLAQRPYREPGRRSRASFHLTERGLDLFPVFAALKAWGDDHLADPEGPSTVNRHGGCGCLVGVELRCARGHRIGRPQEVEVRQGPAARALSAYQRTASRAERQELAKRPDPVVDVGMFATAA
jgi:HxlR-like helix-turn-helix